MHTMQATLAGDSCPAFSDGKTLTSFQQAQLWSMCHQNPACPTRQILEELAEHEMPLRVSGRHINRLRRQWTLQRQKGRPRGTTPAKGGERPGALTRLTPHVGFLGVHLFAAWLEERDEFGEVIRGLQSQIAWWIAGHPDADFALLHHKPETLLRRFQALFYAPLFGIGKLTGYDRIEHPLATLLGRGYHSSTLQQFLGQLERIEAGEALLPVLLPAEEAGSIGYVDGHLFPFWSTRSLHKGKITMLGRMMAGSQAVITHTETGHAVWVEYVPPDTRMPTMITAYCRQVALTTGISVFVLDREANSVALAREFEHGKLGVLSMLDRNEYDGLTSWEVTPLDRLEDGSLVYEGVWKTPRATDPRHFVLVDDGDRVLAYWGTSVVKASVPLRQWPAVYRKRTALQEQAFKGMKAHGALDVNYGIKLIIGPDRHQQRAFERLDEAKDAAQQKVTKKEKLVGLQEAKVADSLEKGHGTRLEQRQRRLSVIRDDWNHAKDRLKTIQAQIGGLGPAQERADRDVRKQTIMTIRTLWLENSLCSFLTALCAAMGESISLDCLLSLLFERSGASMETPSEMLYWVNTTGLSATYHETLRKILAGIGAMNLMCRGKPIRVRLREAPT